MDKNNFSQKLAELTALAAASENKPQMTQVLDAFAKEQVTPEEMEAIRQADRNCRLIKGQVFLWPGARGWEDLWDMDGSITQ